MAREFNSYPPPPPLRYLFTGSEDGTVSIWNLGGNLPSMAGNRSARGRARTSRMRQMGSLPVCAGRSVNDVCVLPLSGFLATAGADGDVKVWDYMGAAPAVLKTLRHHDEVPKCVAVKESLVDSRIAACLYVGTKEGNLLKFMVDPDTLGKERGEGGEGKEGEAKDGGGGGRGGLLDEGDEEKVGDDLSLVDSENEYTVGINL